MEKLSITAQKHLLVKTQLGDNIVLKYLYSQLAVIHQLYDCQLLIYNMESPDTCLP